MLAGTDYLQRSQGCRHQVRSCSVFPLSTIHSTQSNAIRLQFPHQFRGRTTIISSWDETQVQAIALRVRNFLRRDSADCEIATNSRPKSWSLPHLTSASTCMAVTWSGILKVTAK